MIKIYCRDINQAEAQELDSRQPSVWTRIERFTLMMIGITIVLLIPFLIIDSFFQIPSQPEGIIVIALLIIAILLTIYWTKRDPAIAFEKHLKKVREVEVIHCKTKRAIKRKDPEDFGISFYLDTGDGRTLFLQGQYLDLLEYDKKFPNTDFELVRIKESKEVIDLKTNGDYFEPERTLEAFSMDDYKKGAVPEDGDILFIEFEEIT